MQDQLLPAPRPRLPSSSVTVSQTSSSPRLPLPRAHPSSHRCNTTHSSKSFRVPQQGPSPNEPRRTPPRGCAGSSQDARDQRGNERVRGLSRLWDVLGLVQSKEAEDLVRVGVEQGSESGWRASGRRTRDERAELLFFFLLPCPPTAQDGSSVPSTCALVHSQRHRHVNPRSKRRAHLHLSPPSLSRFSSALPQGDPDPRHHRLHVQRCSTSSYTGQRCSVADRNGARRVGALVSTRTRAGAEGVG